MFQNMNIFSKPSLKMICFLGRRYREEYHTRELVRRLKIGLGSASRYLRILEKEELVIKEEKGKLNIYRANMENPLLKELKLVFTLMEIDEMVKDLKKVSSQIILFGSCFEGEDSEESDIDYSSFQNEGKHVNKKIDQYQNKIQRKISSVIVNDTELKSKIGQ